ncbi:MAG: hypothetical protein QGF31_05940 [Nitrospinota bacterium]|jgi:hypothetical protein|nr:hypothetical protein [Nitrospinota bacterium]
MNSKRLKCEFSDKEIDSWVQNFRRMMKEEPDPNEEVFPNDMNEVNAYIHTLEDLIEKNPTQELKEDLRVYKAFWSGSFNGYATATEYLMKKSDEIQQVSKEDEKVNDLSNKKVFKFLEEEHKKDPDRMIYKKELLKKSKLTKKELKAAGIANVERYSYRKPK